MNDIISIKYFNIYSFFRFEVNFSPVFVKVFLITSDNLTIPAFI